MNTERNHPRDQNSPQVQTMMDELRANAAGIDVAATYPGDPNDTFDIPAGLIPGIDNKLPKAGLVLIYIESAANDHRLNPHFERIKRALGEHLHSWDDRCLAHPSIGSHQIERQRLSELRNEVTSANQLAVVTRPLPLTRNADTMEQEADLSLYIYNGIGGFGTTIIERGKLRRADRVKDQNMALSFRP